MCTRDFSKCSPINRDNERLGDRRKFEDKTSDLTFDKLFDKATNVFNNKKSDLNRKYSKISDYPSHSDVNVNDNNNPVVKEGRKRPRDRNRNSPPFNKHSINNGNLEKRYGMNKLNSIS